MKSNIPTLYVKNELLGGRLWIGSVWLRIEPFGGLL